MKRKRAIHPIAAKRMEKGLSGSALARLVHITPSHLRDIEIGRVASPSVDLALRLADALQADVRALFTLRAA